MSKRKEPPDAPPARWPSHGSLSFHLWILDRRGVAFKSRVYWTEIDIKAAITLYQATHDCIKIEAFKQWPGGRLDRILIWYSDGGVPFPPE